MEKSVSAFMEKHQLLKRGSKVLIGVSGGPDSIALLHYFNQIRPIWDLELAVLSVDHQLRAEAAKADFAFVKHICKQWEIDFHGEALDVPAYEKVHGHSTEVSARTLRYQFFEKKMRELGGDYLALGHHGDDQVETLLMQFVRSASSTAFSGIPLKRTFAGGEIIRPLLAVTKEEIESYCEEHALDFRIDATNFEEEHTRNYFRKHILPLLKEKNSNIHKTAQRLSETLQADEAFLQNEAEHVLESTSELEAGKKKATIEINLFKNHDESLQRRAFHLILNYLYETLPSQLSYIHEEAFFSLLLHKEGNVKIDFPAGLKLNKAYNKLTFYFEKDAAAVHAYSKAIPIPGQVKLPDGSTLTTNFKNKKQAEHRFSFYIAASEISLPLHVRSRRSGDRMTWMGLNGTKKLKDIFIDAKIPLDKREEWPILVDNEGEILWLIGLRKGKQTEVSEQQFIHLTFDKGDIQEE